MITRVIFPGIDPKDIVDEIDYIDKEVAIPVYSAHKGQALDPRNISTIVAKLTRVFKTESGKLSADIETYSRVLDEFKCELIYTAGIWLAVLDEEDVPQFKDPKNPIKQTAVHGQNIEYKRAKPIVPEVVQQAHPYHEQEKKEECTEEAVIVESENNDS